jgi:ABC-type polysaccharide/polyol phosphate export permease
MPPRPPADRTNIGAVLEGTSLGQRGDAWADDVSRAAPTTATLRDLAPRDAEPRPEIWFKRKVRIMPAMRELWDFRELMVTLAERDIRIRYKQAVLGIAWAVITPLIMMIAFTLVFTKVAHVNTHMPGVPYALFSYIGLLPWTFFSTSLSTGGMSLVTNVGLLNKLYCPREVFPIAALADASVDGIIASIILVALFPILGFAPKIESLYVPLLLIPLFAFTLGLTMAVSAVVVFMRDLRLVLPLVIQFGLFVTPVIYSPTALFKSEGLLIGYSIVNPLVPVLDGLRRCVLQGLAPNWASLGAGTATSFAVLFFGFMLFKKLETGIADVA